MRKAGRYWSRIDGKTISGYYRLDPRRLSRSDQAVVGGFLDVPLAGLGWEIGAYLAVAAAALATLPAALAARRSRPRR